MVKTKSWPLSRVAHLIIVLICGLIIVISATVYTIDLIDVSVSSQTKIESSALRAAEMCAAIYNLSIETKILTDPQNNQYHGYFVGDDLFVESEPFQKGKQ